MSPFVKINKMFYIGKLPIKIPTASGDIRLSTERRKKESNYKIRYFIFCSILLSAISRVIVIFR